MFPQQVSLKSELSDTSFVVPVAILAASGVVGWCDGAGSTSSAGASYNLDTVGQGPIALAVGAGGGVWTFLLSSFLSLLFLPLFGRRLDID